MIELQCLLLVGAIKLYYFKLSKDKAQMLYGKLAWDLNKKKATLWHHSRKPSKKERLCFFSPCVTNVSSPPKLCMWETLKLLFQWRIQSHHADFSALALALRTVPLSTWIGRLLFHWVPQCEDVTMQPGIWAACQAEPSFLIQSVTRAPRAHALLSFVICVEQSGPSGTEQCVHGLGPSLEDSV
jgi:hypothetical protein